jgi:cell division protein FtsX
LNDEKPTDASQLLDEVRKLNQHKFVRAHDSWLGLIWFQLVRGLAFGLGSVLGATVLVAVFISMLGELDFIPILGKWAQQILDVLQAGK